MPVFLRRILQISIHCYCDIPPECLKTGYEVRPICPKFLRNLIPRILEFWSFSFVIISHELSVLPSSIRRNFIGIVVLFHHPVDPENQLRKWIGFVQQRNNKGDIHFQLLVSYMLSFKRGFSLLFMRPAMGNASMEPQKAALNKYPKTAFVNGVRITSSFRSGLLPFLPICPF